MIPQGFTPHFRKSKFTDPWEPIYSQVEPEQVRLGVELRDVHCNSRGMVHGGFLATIADNALGLSIAAVLKAKEAQLNGLVTLNLAMDYVGFAQIGEWVATDTTVLKAKGSICFASCVISTEQAPVARANGTFKVMTA